MTDTRGRPSQGPSVFHANVSAGPHEPTSLHQMIEAPASNNSRKTRTPPRISPPPLKRQRTDTGPLTSSPSTHHEFLNRSFPTISNRAAAGDKYVACFAINNSLTNTIRLDVPRPSSFSSTSSRRPSLRNVATLLPSTVRRSSELRGCEDDDGSMSSDIARSARSRESSTTAPKCKLCDKIINKSFDPLVLCNVCHRSFHDACRRPPLSAGADP
jgi:hypothetical protein